MSEDSYERLADALDRLPNAFPRTASGVELHILRKICSPEEADLASLLTAIPEPADGIASRAGTSTREARRRLFGLARRGIAWLDDAAGEIRFRLAPFIVGIYEAQLESMDHELAHLVEEYLSGGGAAGIMGPQPALQRVVPTSGTLKLEAILPYDDVRSVLVRQRAFQINECICRLQQSQLGASCFSPTRVCLSFSSRERKPREGDVTLDEALRLLDMTEEIGLVHTVTNISEGFGYLCNCCACCCGLLRGITTFGVAGSVAAANYVAVIDPDLCDDCGTCIDRCQVGAVSAGAGFSVVDRDRCIGCGLCVSGCPNDVARLERRPEAEVVHPPRDFAEWERMRLATRGLRAAVAAD